MKTTRTSRILGVALVGVAAASCGGGGGECSLAPDTWQGRLVTEAINITLEVEVLAPGTGDAGDWRFVGAGGQVLNQGDLQAWQGGSMVDMILFEEGAASGSLLTGGFVDGCDRIEGQYVVNAGSGGGFELTRR